MNHKNTEQDGPSLESSSYLNLSLRYLGPWGPGTLGMVLLWGGEVSCDI